MKYDNAEDILPDELLKEIQKYAAGKLLYIPSGDQKRAWGETSGYRNQLQKRNQMIRNKYAHGLTLSELADEYYLSLDSIKKILYSKKNEHHLLYSPTIASAVTYAQSGMLEEWLQCFMLFTQTNKAEEYRFARGELLFGVIKFPLRLIEMEAFDLSVAVMDSSETRSLIDNPPLIVQYENGKFYSRIQQQLFITLKQSNTNAYPSLILIKDHTDYKRFMEWFGNVFIYVDKV